MSVFDIQISDETEGQIRSLIKWSKIFAIIGFLFMFFFAFVSILFYWSDIDSENPNANLELCAVIMTISVVLFLPSLLAYRLSRHLKEAVVNSTQFHFDLGLKYTANFFKIVVMSIFIFIIISYLIITFI